MFFGPGLGSRCRARLSVRGESGATQIGIFEAGSHRLVDISECPLHHPSFSELVRPLVRALDACRIAPYHEETHSGVVRAVQLALDRSTSQVQVVLLVRDGLSDKQAMARLFAPVREALEQTARLHSLWLGALPERTNRLFAGSYLRLWGPGEIEDRSGGAAVFYPPHAFGQANPALHDGAVARIQGHVADGDSVVEYYAGVGTIGLGLLARGCHVLFNELGEGSLLGLAQGLLAQQRDPSGLILAGQAGDFAAQYSASDVVIVDPPRKGLDPQLLTRFLKQPPRKLIYLSCGLDALCREAEQLLSAHRLALVDASVWGYFPFSRHVETLLVFDRKGSGGRAAREIDSEEQKN